MWARLSKRWDLEALAVHQLPRSGEVPTLPLITCAILGGLEGERLWLHRPLLAMNGLVRRRGGKGSGVVAGVLCAMYPPQFD